MLVDPKRPSYVLFLTDGMPTVGEQNEMKIVANVRQADKGHARISIWASATTSTPACWIASRAELGGESLYVRPNENIETYVSAFAKSIASPVLTDLDVKFDFDAPRVPGAAEPIWPSYPGRSTDRPLRRRAARWVDRYKKSGPVKLTLSGRNGEKRETFTLNAVLDEHSVGDANGFVEKVWATRRIGELIDKIDLHGQNKELVNELVQLSKKHGIMTPYTSFLADEHVDITNQVQLQGRTNLSLQDNLSLSGGEKGVATQI